MLYSLNNNNNNNKKKKKKKNDIFTVFALQINRRACVTPHVIFLVVIQQLISRIERHKGLAGLLFRVR